MVLTQRSFIKITGHEGDVGKPRSGHTDGLFRNIDSRHLAKMGQLVGIPTWTTPHVQDEWLIKVNTANEAEYLLVTFPLPVFDGVSVISLLPVPVPEAFLLIYLRLRSRGH